MVRMRTVKSTIRRLKRAKRNEKKLEEKQQELESAHELARRLTAGTLVRTRVPLVIVRGDYPGTYDSALPAADSVVDKIGTRENPPVLMYLRSEWLPYGPSPRSVQRQCHLFSLEGKTVILSLVGVAELV